jgi:D-inositol-3-phosphate glycosyltransferase
MRILFVLEYYAPHVGGAETLFQNLCEGLTARGHVVDVITSKIAGTKES